MSVPFVDDFYRNRFAWPFFPLLPSYRMILIFTVLGQSLVPSSWLFTGLFITAIFPLDVNFLTYLRKSFISEFATKFVSEICIQCCSENTEIILMMLNMMLNIAILKWWSCWKPLLNLIHRHIQTNCFKLWLKYELGITNNFLQWWK